jgi:hypothetical protein
MEKDKEENLQNNSLRDIGVQLTALGIFYTLIFQIFSNSLAVSAFWKYCLIYFLFIFSFFFSLSIAKNTQKGDTSIEKIAGRFIMILWLLILLLFADDMGKAVISLFSQISSIGLGWLIILPSFAIPIILVIVFNKKYQEIKSYKGKIVYSIFVGISIFLLYSIIGKWSSKIVTILMHILIQWIQILLIGIIVGLLTGLIIAPILPLIGSFLNFLNKKFLIKSKSSISH